MSRSVEAPDPDYGMSFFGDRPAALPVGSVTFSSVPRVNIDPFGVVQASLDRMLEEKRRAGAQQERLNWLSSFVPSLLAFLASIEANGVDVRPLQGREASPVVRVVREWVEERVLADADLIERDLNTAWARVNALGGRSECEDCGECRECGYGEALLQVLGILEKMGAEDPSKVKARLARLQAAMGDRR